MPVFHGNAMVWPDGARVTELLASRGYGVLLAEYRGYNRADHGSRYDQNGYKPTSGGGQRFDSTARRATTATIDNPPAPADLTRRAHVGHAAAGPVGPNDALLVGDWSARAIGAVIAHTRRC